MASVGGVTVPGTSYDRWQDTEVGDQGGEEGTEGGGGGT